MRLKQDLFIVGVELPHRETAAARQPTERIREPPRQEVIECEQIAALAEQFALVPRQCPHCASCRPHRDGKINSRRTQEFLASFGQLDRIFMQLFVVYAS